MAIKVARIHFAEYVTIVNGIVNNVNISVIIGNLPG